MAAAASSVNASLFIVALLHSCARAGAVAEKDALGKSSIDIICRYVRKNASGEDTRDRPFLRHEFRLRIFGASMSLPAVLRVLFFRSDGLFVFASASDHASPLAAKQEHSTRVAARAPITSGLTKIRPLKNPQINFLRQSY
jgi:hypothetical protein